MTNSPLISIITPSYNSEDTILRCYESIKTQDYENWEWLVTDDCSSDKTVSVLNKICKLDNRVKVFSNDLNLGAGISRNNSIDKSKGDFLAFLDSDDEFLDTKLSSQLNFMMNNSYEFTFTAYVEKKNNIKRYVDLRTPDFVSYNMMLKKMCTIGCSTVMIDRKIVPQILFQNLRTGQDYLAWLNLLKLVDGAYKIPKVLTVYNVMKGSISRNKFKKSLRQWEIYRKYEKCNFLLSSYYFFFYAKNAVFKK